MPIDRQPPDVLAMVLADTILRDLVTGKNVIQGTFSVILANEFPVIYPAIAVYVAITGGHGPTELELRLIDVDEEHEPLFSIRTNASFPDPIVVAEVVFSQQQVCFSVAGEYRLQLFGDGHLLKERRLYVTPPPEPS